MLYVVVPLLVGMVVGILSRRGGYRGRHAEPEETVPILTSDESDADEPVPTPSSAADDSDPDHRHPSTPGGFTDGEEWVDLTDEEL